MIIIRETFTTRPGMASKLAALFKEVLPGLTKAKTRVLTDWIGPFNTVVMETEVEDLAAFETMMKEYAERKDVRERLKGYADMYVTGKREVYRVM